MKQSTTYHWEMKMRKYEIKDKEWEIVRQLVDILKVNINLFPTSETILTFV